MTPRYQFLRRISTSASSTVDQVRDDSTGRLAALKRCLPGKDDWLRAEARVLILFHHPKAVRLLDSGEDDAGPYLVLDWIEGGPLEDHLRREPLGDASWRAMLDSLLSALAALHSTGFAHADISAANLLMPPAGGCMLIDFGNAWPLSSTARRHITDANPGSVHFMAPELFQGSPPGIASDLYAVGVLAFYAHTGRLPFDGDHAAQVIAAHLRQPMPMLGGSPFNGWLHHLLSRDPLRRPASALEALEALP